MSNYLNNFFQSDNLPKFLFKHDKNLTSRNNEQPQRQELKLNFVLLGLLFIMIILTCTSSVIGCIEVLSSATVDELSNIRGYKPAIIFTFISCIFMLDLSMATKGGIHLYYLLTTYYTTSWYAYLLFVLF